MDRTQKSSQWTVLAGTRFLLALCVLFTHSGIVEPGYFLFRHFGVVAYPAVFGFFMVSGYSIAASLASRPDGYLFRRIRRIYPTYLLALAFSTLILLPHPLHLPAGQVIVPNSWQTVVSNVFMLQGTLTQSLLANGPIWSLAIEWWCYIAAILLIRWSNWVTKLLIALSFASMVIYIRSKGYIVGDNNMPLGLCVPLFAWAWLTGFSYQREPTKTNFAVMMLLPLVMFEVGPTISLASIVIAASALAVYFSKSIHIKSKKAERVIQWLGDMSYPLYVFHAPIFYVLASYGIIRNGNYLVLWGLVIVSVGYFFACLVLKSLSSKVTRAIQNKSSSSGQPI
jgi:peptidoglycan/LPS O-acetylase OafA/YrhL